jgi:hypothetical protein
MVQSIERGASMFGLCFGLAVTVNGSNGVDHAILRVRDNLEEFKRPVLYTRYQAFLPCNAYGISACYYRALDRCKLRMS